VGRRRATPDTRRAGRGRWSIGPTFHWLGACPRRHYTGVPEWAGRCITRSLDAGRVVVARRSRMPAGALKQTTGMLDTPQQVEALIACCWRAIIARYGNRFTTHFSAGWHFDRRLANDPALCRELFCERRLRASSPRGSILRLLPHRNFLDAVTCDNPNRQHPVSDGQFRECMPRKPKTFSSVIE